MSIEKAIVWIIGVVMVASVVESVMNTPSQKEAAEIIKGLEDDLKEERGNSKEAWALVQELRAQLGAEGRLEPHREL